MKLSSLQQVTRRLFLGLFFLPVILLFISIVIVKNDEKYDVPRQYTLEEMLAIKDEIFSKEFRDDSYQLIDLNHESNSNNSSNTFIKSKIKSENQIQYLPNRLLIKVEKEKFNNISAIKGVLNNELNLNVSTIPTLSDWYRITIQDEIDYTDMDTLNCISALQNSPSEKLDVNSYQNDKCRLINESQLKTARIKEKLLYNKIGLVENEKMIYSYVNNQSVMWNIKNIGQEYPGIGLDANGNLSISMYTGTIGNDINVESIWQTGNKGANVVVAVVDGGGDFFHPDLANNIWLNTDEIPDNGIDEDNNGYIDDVNGYDFASIDFCEDGPDSLDCQDVDSGADNNPMDYRGHGTHVAGTIAATMQEPNENIVGVSPEATIMPVRFISSFGYGLDSDAASSIVYAVDNGADVINCSWGGSNSEIIADAILYAKSHEVKVVFAAGNDSSNDFIKTFSGNEDTIDDVIMVGSINANNQISNFSNYGYLVDIFAPGEDILSLASSGGVAYPEFIYNGDYILSGTSMSAPNVSGIIALMESRYKAENSGQRISPEIVKTRLHSTAVDMLDEGYDFTSSYGKIDANASVNSNLNVWAEIEYPNKHVYISDSLETVFSVSGEDLTSWALEVTEINSVNWRTEYSGTESVENASVNIDTSQYENGDYILRLKYSDGDIQSYMYRRFSKSEYADYQVNANYHFNDNNYLFYNSRIYNFQDGEKLLHHGSTLYLSSNGAIVWNPIINLPNNSPIEGSFVSSEDFIFISCGSGIYKSTDRAASWIKIFDSEAYLSQYVNHDAYLNSIIGGDIVSKENSITASFTVMNQNLIYYNFFDEGYFHTEFEDAGTRFFVYKSDDGGTTWYEISNQLGSIRDVDNIEYPVSYIKNLSIISEDSYLVASSEGEEVEAHGYISIDGLFKKNNYGSYIQVLLPSFDYNNIEYLPISVNNVFVDSNGVNYVLVYDNRYNVSLLYKSSDNGVSWIPEYLDNSYVYTIGEIEIDGEQLLAYTEITSLSESGWVLRVRDLNSTEWAYCGSSVSGPFIGINESNLAITDSGYLYKIGETMVEGDFSYAYEYYSTYNQIIEPGNKYILNIGTYFPNDQIIDISLIAKPNDSLEIGLNQLEWDVALGTKRQERAIVLTENNKGKTINILEYTIDNKPVIDVPSKVKILIGRENKINLVAQDLDNEHVQFDIYGSVPGINIDMRNHELQINPDPSLLGNNYTLNIVPVSGFYITGDQKNIEIEIIDNWYNTTVTGEVYNDLNRNGVRDNATIENEVKDTKVSLYSLQGSGEKILQTEKFLLNSSRFELFPQSEGEYEIVVVDLNEEYPITTTGVSILQGDNKTKDIGLINIEESLTDLQLEGSLNATVYSPGDQFVLNGKITNFGSGDAFEIVLNLSLLGVSQIDSASINGGECNILGTNLECNLAELQKNTNSSFQITGQIGESDLLSINADVSNFVYESNVANNSITLEAEISPLDFSDIQLELINRTGDNSIMSPKTATVLVKNIGTITSEETLLNIDIPYSAKITDASSYCQTNSIDFYCRIAPLEENEDLQIQFQYYIDDYVDATWRIESKSPEDRNRENNTLVFIDKIVEKDLLVYVSKEGIDENKGTKEKPVLTINRALQICQFSASASESCSIRVSSGIYNENIVVKSNIKLRGGYCISHDRIWDRDLELCKTIIQGGISVPEPNIIRSTTINTEKNLVKKGVITINGSNILLDGFVVSNHKSINMPVAVTYSQTTTLSNLVFANNHQTKTDPDSASLYIGNSSNITIDRITVSNNIDNGINIKSSSSVKIKNSIVSSNSFTGIKGFRSTIDVTYSNIFGNSVDVAGFSIGENNISVDPKYIAISDMTTIDYFRFLKDTPCAFAGRFSYLGALRPME